MLEFEFHNPTKIIFGKGRIREAGRHVKEFSEKALLVMGCGSVRKSGIFDVVSDSLKEHGVNVEVLEGIQSNPVLSKVEEGIEIMRDKGLNLVIALGGGSVMDSAKAIAAGTPLEKGHVWDFFIGKQEIARALPIVTIPTLAASGSEMNGYMVITNEQTGHKLATRSPHIYPRISILDPETTYTVSKDYTAYGGVDAVCHLLEPYFNGPYPYTPVQDRLAEGLIKTIMETTKDAIKSPHNYDSRASLMWAATLALCGLTKAGIGEHFFPVHVIEHAVSAIFNVPHGAGLAALLPGWMKWRAEVQPEKIVQLGVRVLDIAPPANAENSIDAFKVWLKEVGCPVRLSELGIGEDDHEQIADNARLQIDLGGMDPPYAKDVVLKILAYSQ